MIKKNLQTPLVLKRKQFDWNLIKTNLQPLNASLVYLSNRAWLMFGKRKRECSTLEMHSLGNKLTSAQMALFQNGCLLQNVMAVQWANSHAKKELVTQLWSSKIGVLKLNFWDCPTKIKRDIYQEKILALKQNLHVVIISIFD